MTRGVFFELFLNSGAASEEADGRGFRDVDIARLTDCRRSFAYERMVWLDKFGEGRAVEEMRVKHHVRRQRAGYEWDPVKKEATEKSPHFVEELIVMLTKKVYAES